MALDALLARFEGRAVTSVTAGATPDVTPKPAPAKACTSVTSVTAQNDDTAGKATGEPLSDQARLGDGVAPEAELIALVDAVADFHGFSPEQRAEAKQIALADLDAALECFAILAARIPQPARKLEDGAIANER